MKILWITSSASLTRLPGGRMTADQASARLRMCVPGEELIRRGHEVLYVSVQEGMQVDALLQQTNPDLLIFCKSALKSNELLLQAARAKGIKVILDICDNHFVHHLNAPHYRYMAQHADMVTCSTKPMMEVTAAETDKPCFLVEDPYESAVGEPKFNPSQTVLRVLWFGNFNNVGGLYESINDLYKVSQRIPVHLTALTNYKPVFAEDMNSVAGQTGGRLVAEAIAWSAERQKQELEVCDLVIVPVTYKFKPAPEIDDAHTKDFMKVKSPNRVVEPLRSGRMVVAHPKDSYEPFRDFAWIGGDMAEGIRWCLDHADEIPARIAAGQAYIEKHHSPSVIADQWERVLKKADTTHS